MIRIKRRLTDLYCILLKTNSSESGKDKPVGLEEAEEKRREAKEADSQGKKQKEEAESIWLMNQKCGGQAALQPELISEQTCFFFKKPQELGNKQNQK